MSKEGENLMVILTTHIGEEKAIGMGELYERVFEKHWRNRINDTRALRSLITRMRHQGSLIGEIRSSNGGGYYLARSTHELEKFFDKRKKEALKKLYMISRMKKISLPDLLGQMRISMTDKGIE